MNKIYIDHKGRQFRSVKAMCEYHGVNRSTYIERRKRGYSVEESLSKYRRYRGALCSDHKGISCSDRKGISCSDHKGISCSDHKGKQFISVQEMCDYHGVKRGTYESRRKQGYSVEESLAKEYKDIHKEHNGISCSDPEGRQFKSVKAMCDYHGVSRKIYDSRRRRGCSVGKSLSSEILPIGEPCIDHEGNRFESVKAMCKCHGVNVNTYTYRRRLGYSVAESLSKEHKGTSCSDHEGRYFESVQKMCDYHGVKRVTYDARRKRGCSVKESLAKK